jgi:hypothetical protein
MKQYLITAVLVLVVMYVVYHVDTLKKQIVTA